MSGKFEICETDLFLFGDQNVQYYQNENLFAECLRFKFIIYFVITFEKLNGRTQIPFEKVSRCLLKSSKIEGSQRFQYDSAGGAR